MRDVVRPKGERGRVGEDTIVREMDLPDDLGRDWEFFADLNVVVLRRGMDSRAREAAVEDLQREVRRRVLRVVPSPDAAATG